MRTGQRCAWALLAGVLGAVLAGCGTPGAPQPPSLNLPDRVMDLAATRTGDRVRLTWTMPKRNTDKLALKSDVDVRVCRMEGSGACVTAGGRLKVAPGAKGAFTETLPAALTEGTPRALTYFVELKNSKGRSAGLSNGVVVLAGAAPAQVTGLDAEMRKEGVVLRWTPDSEPVDVRLERKLLTPPPAKEKKGLMAPQPEPLEQNLLVAGGSQAGRAIDKSIRFGETYAYRAQRVARVDVDGKTLALAGALSEPVRVEAKNVFPPAVPTGLAAVGSVGENGMGPSIDLSWTPDAEADLAGYIVYRREAAALGNAGEWERISPAQPVVGPAFHDATVVAGHTYQYAVSAVGQNGHESERSASAEESVPRP